MGTLTVNVGLEKGPTFALLSAALTHSDLPLFAAHPDTLTLLTALSALTLNMVLPSLPSMARDLAARESVTALAVSGYMLASALFQLGRYQEARQLYRGLLGADTGGLHRFGPPAPVAWAGVRDAFDPRARVFRRRLLSRANVTGSAKAEGGVPT